MAFAFLLLGNQMHVYVMRGAGPRRQKSSESAGKQVSEFNLAPIHG